jgi:hypothetical protein
LSLFLALGLYCSQTLSTLRPLAANAGRWAAQDNLIYAYIIGKLIVKRLILLIFLLATACDVSPDEQSILDNSSCDLPCWNGIIPGHTTESEFLAVLQSLPDIDADSIQSQKPADAIFDKVTDFAFRQNWTLSQRPRLHGRASFVDNTIGDFIICGAINTSMDQLVGEIGEPEHIISGNDIGGGRTVILINSEAGISYFFGTELDNLEIAPSTQIDCINIFVPSLFEALLDAGGFSNGYYNAEETRRVWYSWNGYGNLQEKYPPRQP